LDPLQKTLHPRFNGAECSVYLIYFIGGMAVRFLAVVVLALMSVGQAAAAEIFTNNTMFMRVQCEIGEFAKDTKSSGLALGMKADVNFSWTVEESTKAKASGGIRWLFGRVTVKQARGWEQKSKSEIARPFNVHEKNAEACQNDRLKVPLGIRECLLGSVDALKAGSNVSCEKTKAVGVNTNAEGEVTLLQVIDVNAGAEYDVKTTYNVKVSAPTKQ
jgi:hypothetical protein